MSKEYRVLNSDGPPQRVRIRFFKSFDQMQFVAMLQAVGIQPGPIFKGNRVNNECVAFLVADRVSHPLRIIHNVAGVLASDVNKPKAVHVFHVDRDCRWVLDDLKRH